MVDPDACRASSTQAPHSAEPCKGRAAALIAAISSLSTIAHKDRNPLTATYSLLLSKEVWLLQSYSNRSRLAKASRKCRLMTVVLLKSRVRKVEGVEEVEEAPGWVGEAVGEVPQLASEVAVLLSSVVSSLVACQS